MGHLSPNTQWLWCLWALPHVACTPRMSLFCLRLCKGSRLSRSPSNVPLSQHFHWPLCCHSNESIPGTSYTYTRSPSIARVSEHKLSPSSIARCPGWTWMAIQEQEKGQNYHDCNHVTNTNMINRGQFSVKYWATGSPESPSVPDRK